MRVEARETVGSPAARGISTRRRRSSIRVSFGDALGLALAAGAAAWTLVAARSAEAALPVVGLIAASAVAFAVARLATSVRPWVVPAGIALFAALLAARAGRGTIDRHPLSGPLGYSNADSALFVQAAIAAVILAWVLPRRGQRMLAAAGAVAFASLPLFKDSMAAFSLLSLVGLGLLPGTAIRARAVVSTCGALFVAALVITAILGATYRTHEGGRLVGPAVNAGLSELRLRLWHDAVVLVREHPVMGVGPGRFAAVSPTAQANRDARRAHNEFLQQGAEQGIPGALLAAGLFLWGFARLRAARPDRFTVLAAVALAALGIQASIDYVLHFSAVPLTAAALLGAATGERPDGVGSRRHVR